MYFLWAVDNWKGPADKAYLPENTFIKKNMAWTKMTRNQDSFSLTLTLPKNTQVNYMFWIPVDENADSTDGWDTYGNIMYSTQFTENRKFVQTDEAIYIPEKALALNVLKSGKIIFIVSSILCLTVVIARRRSLSFSKTGFVGGTFFGALCLLTLIRLQMNRLLLHPQKIFGAVFQDLLCLSAICALFILLLTATKKYRLLSYGVFTLFVVVTTVFTLFSILNIEIVRQLGRPLNYQWLYYSDFMNGTDAKNAMAYNLSPALKLNIILLVIAVGVSGVAASFLSTRWKRMANYGLLSLFLFFLIAGYVQVKNFTYTEATVKNPLTELISSAMTAGQKPPLFSMKISTETNDYIRRFHERTAWKIPDSASAIHNIILFVMESTPRNVLSIYDSSMQVTPQLAKYRNISTAFYNMYAHIPSTPNSMLSLVCGIYPLITYKSFLNEYAVASLPALPAELKASGWQTGFFSSSNLGFSNMRSFAQANGFETVEDNTTIKCDLKPFRITNTTLDGLNDKCIVSRYFQWLKDNKAGKKYAMMWTNQTHYPYFFDPENETAYTKNNKELNHYLNALHNSDEAFGRLMSGLEERGLLQSTMVIVIGDHGEAFGTHNQTTHASHIYEENILIPFLVYNPILCKGDTSQKITELVDIVPTIASVAGLQDHAEWQGKSVFSTDQHDRAFFISPYSDFLFGTRTGKWKYIYNATLNNDELYDLSSDPGELKNLASQHPDIIKREFEMIGAWVQYHEGKIKAWEKEQKIRNK